MGQLKEFEVLPIERDVNRFRQIVRGQARENLRKFIGSDKMIGKKGKDLVSIPVPNIELPRFRFGDNQVGGVGQGPGQEGDTIGTGDPSESGDQAGDQPGQHLTEVEMEFEEVLEELMNLIELPNIRPSTLGNIYGGEKLRRTSRQVPPTPYHDLKASFKRALKEFPGDPLKAIIMSRVWPHARYKSTKTIRVPIARAVIIYEADISGSMSRDKREVERLIAFWISSALGQLYNELVERFIAHDVVAAEVDSQTFFALEGSGGTKISSAYQLAAEIIAKDYLLEDWNVFVIHFSDGENFDNADTQRCKTLLQDTLVPLTRLFAFVKIKGTDKSFSNMLDEIPSPPDAPENSQRLIKTSVDTTDEVLDGILDILGRKKKEEDQT